MEALNETYLLDRLLRRHPDLPRCEKIAHVLEPWEAPLKVFEAIPDGLLAEGATRVFCAMGSIC